MQTASQMPQYLLMSMSGQLSVSMEAQVDSGHICKIAEPKSILKIRKGLISTNVKIDGTKDIINSKRSVDKGEERQKK